MKLFDEFGNFVGDYTPRGGGIEGVVAAIGLIVVGFMFYTIYWIIKEWLKAFSKALENRNLGLALVCLIPPCAIGLVMVMTFVAILAGSAVQAVTIKAEATRVAEEKLAMEINPPVDVFVEKGMCDENIYEGCPWGTDMLYILITITNKWDGVMATMGATTDAVATYVENSRLMCDPSMTWYYLEPGEIRKFACVVEWGDEATVIASTKICVNFFPKYPGASPHFLNEAKPIVCKNLP